jgi:hypothetical protein
LQEQLRTCVPAPSLLRNPSAAARPWQQVHVGVSSPC